MLVQVYLTTVTLNQEEDTYEWEVMGRNCTKFSTGEICTYIMGDKQTVLWSSVVWCSYGIPRQSFLSWLVVLDRCPTKDRLLRSGMSGVDPVCLLCNSAAETRNHIFFDFSYGRVVWTTMAFQCQFQPSTNKLG